MPTLIIRNVKPLTDLTTVYGEILTLVVSWVFAHLLRYDVQKGNSACKARVSVLDTTLR